MFQRRPVTMDAEETSIHILPQPIVSSGSHSRNTTNRYEDPDGTQEFHLELSIVVHKDHRTDLLVKDVTFVESLVVILISIRLIYPHHHVEVRHHHLLPPELHWMIHYLNMSEIHLFHREVIRDVSSVDVPIVLHAYMTRPLHPGLREFRRP